MPDQVNRDNTLRIGRILPTMMTLCPRNPGSSQAWGKMYTLSIIDQRGCGWVVWFFSTRRVTRRSGACFNNLEFWIILPAGVPLVSGHGGLNRRSQHQFDGTPLSI